MANKNNILSIPLNGELCLNKNKVDITQFTGWNKVNGPIYGGCLSPLYSMQKTFADVWDRNGNYFNIDNGTLKKNGVNVLSFSNTGFKKESSNLDYKAFDVYVSGQTETIYGLKEIESGIYEVVTGNETAQFTVFTNASEICTKVKRVSSGKVYFIVVYVQSDGAHYWIRQVSDTKMENFTGTLPITFKNAGVQIASLNDNATMVSFFSDFGPDQTDCIKANLIIDGSTVYSDVNFNCVQTLDTVTAYKENILTATATFSFTKVLNYGVMGVPRFRISQPWLYNIGFFYFNANDDITNEGGELFLTMPAGQTERDSGQNLSPAACKAGSKWAIRTQSYNPATGQLETVTLPCDFVYDKLGGNTSSYGNTQTLYSSYTAQASYVVNVEAVNDDGNLYACSKPVTEDAGKVPQGGVVCVKGTFDSVTILGTAATVNFNAVKYFNIDYVNGDNSAIGPQKYDSYSISMGQGGYIRIIYNFVSGNGETHYNYEYDSTFDKLTYCGGVLPGTARNLFGGDSNLNNWRILYNNGYISNISYYDAEGQIGTLIADWNTIDDAYNIVRLEDRVYYKTTKGELVKVSLTTQKDWNYKFLQDRYLIINTVSYYNAYDSKLNIKFHYASDYNNRVNLGRESNIVNTIPDYKTVIVASSQNGNYETTGKSISSAQFGAVVYANVVKGFESFKDCNAPENDELSQINLYVSDGSESTAAVYETSYLNSIFFNSPSLIDLVFPVSSEGNMLYNPNIFTKFVSTYNNKDLVTSDGTSYSLVYSGINPVLLFAMLSGIEDIDSLFVIQTQYYGVSGNKIYSMSFNNGVVILGDVVANITGMQYLGALPTRALFYSPMNRCIYSFGGDAILQLNVESNEITEIYGTWYNTATQALYLGTNNGLYILSDLFIYKLDYQEVKDIFFSDDGHSIINTTVSTFLSYNQEENFQPIELDLETKYFGLGNNQTANIDCWYIKLYNNDKKEAGKVSVQCSTITDKGTVNEKKEFQILANTWDKNDDYIYLRYQPSLQKGIGCKLMLKTKFPIIDIAVSYTAFDGAAQVSHSNL